MGPDMLWSARIIEHDDTRTVALTGEIDLTGADELHRLLITELDDPAVMTVTADLANVTFLDSAALGALIRAFHHADGIGRHFFARNPTRPVRRVLDMTGIYDILNPPACTE